MLRNIYAHHQQQTKRYYNKMQNISEWWTGFSVAHIISRKPMIARGLNMCSRRSQQSIIGISLNNFLTYIDEYDRKMETHIAPYTFVVTSGRYFSVI